MSSLFKTKRRGDRLGGTEGTELLTCAAAVMLTAPLLAEGMMLVAAALDGGVALALELLPQMTGWRA